MKRRHLAAALSFRPPSMPPNCIKVRRLLFPEEIPTLPSGGSAGSAPPYPGVSAQFTIISGFVSVGKTNTKRLYGIYAKL